MLRPGGVMEFSCDGVVTTFDSVTCRHCQKLSARRQRTALKGIVGRDDPDDIGGVCGGCGKIVCFACAGKKECREIERRLDEYERRHASKMIVDGQLLRGTL